MANEPKPADWDVWRPWYHMYDHERQRTVRVYKEPEELPIVIELSRDAAFRERARLWAWSTQGPTPKAMASDNWPPKWGTPIQTIGRYYYEVYRGFNGNMPHMLEPTPTSIEEAMNQAKALSAANPFLRF
jgi:hypothetical protein